MSTRSFVGVMSDAGILGAYVHGDGHPSWVGTQVQKILKRDGFEKFGQTILEGCEGGGFSWLDADTNANQEDRRCKIIGGYGGAYTDESGCEPMTLRGALSHEGGQEYAYVARPDGLIDIYKIGYGVRDHLKWTVGLDEELSNVPPAGAVVVKA